MTVERLWRGTPLVRAWPVKLLLLALLAVAVFLLPYLFPVAPSISLSYVLQYSNRAALLLFTGGAVLYALLTGGAMCRADAVDRPLRWRHLAVALLVIFVLASGQALRSLSRSAGMESFYSINRSMMLADGVRPFTGFSYTYGPLELYPPMWLHQLTNRPITTTYYVWLIVQWLVGTAMLWFTVRHLPCRLRWRGLLFWVLLELCLVTLVADGTTYNPVRLMGTAFAAVVLAEVHRRWRNGYATAVYALGLVAINMGISADLGLAIAAGAVLWFLALWWKRGLPGGAVLLLLCGIVGIVLFAKAQGYFIAMAMFGAGAYALPLLPTAHMALTLFVYVAAACGAVAAWRAGQFDTAVLPLAFMGLAGLPAAFGRADEVHLRMASAAFVLGLAWLLQHVVVRRVWTTLVFVTYLFPVSRELFRESRRQASVFAHTLLHAQVVHPFAVAMQGEPAMQGMANQRGVPFFAAASGSLRLRPPCPVVYFAPTLTPPRGVAPSSVCVDTGAFKVAGNLFTTQAIQLKADELLREPRRTLLLLDMPLEEQFPTIEDDPRILPLVQGYSPLHPRVKRAPMTYGLLIDAIRDHYTPDAHGESGFRVWRPKP